MSEVPERYLELGLRLGRHLDGLIDAYFGPPEIKERVDAEEPRNPTELAHDAAVLLEGLDGLEAKRRTWLQAQLVGLETVARRLAGDEIPFVEEVERCYGIAPERAPEDRFEAAHEALDEVLPGDGTLAERFQAWRDTTRSRASSLPPSSTPSAPTCAAAPSSSSACLRERTSTSTTSPMSRGRHTTTTSAVCAAGWR